MNFEEPIRLEFILSVATTVLKEWNLNINTSKTEFVEFYLIPGEEDANKEPWRQTKLLGSYMCSTYDIHMRCIAGNVAFNIQQLQERVATRLSYKHQATHYCL